MAGRTDGRTDTSMLQGADNIIMERSTNYADSSKAKTEEHLGVFSNDGLRTLVLAKRDFTKVRSCRSCIGRL